MDCCARWIWVQSLRLLRPHLAKVLSAATSCVFWQPMHKPPTCIDNSLTLWPSQAVLIWERRGAGVVRTWAGVQSEGWTATVATLNTSSLRWAASYLSHLVTLVLSTLLLLLLLLLRVFTSVAASRLSRSLGFSSMVTTRPPSPALRLLSSGQSPQGMGSAQETKPTWSKTLKPVKWLAPLRDPSAPRFPASTMVTLQQRQGRRWHQRRQGKSLWWRSRRRRLRASQVSALLMGAGAGGWSSPPSWSTSSVSENLPTIYHPTPCQTIYFFSRRNHLLLWHLPCCPDRQVQRWQGLCFPYSVHPRRHHPRSRYVVTSEKNLGPNFCDATCADISTDPTFIGRIWQLHSDPHKMDVKWQKSHIN